MRHLVSSFFKLHSDSFMGFTNTHKEDLALQLLNVVFYAYKAVPGL